MPAMTPKINQQADGLDKAPAIGRRSQPGFPAKCSGERACLAESHGESDFGHRLSGLCQQALGALDTSTGMIAMRRPAKGLLERAAEMIRAQLRRDRLGEVFFDIGDHGPFLPGGKPTADLRLCGRLPGMKAYQL